MIIPDHSIGSIIHKYVSHIIVATTDGHVQSRLPEEILFVRVMFGSQQELTQIRVLILGSDMKGIISVAVVPGVLSRGDPDYKMFGTIYQ